MPVQRYALAVLLATLPALSSLAQEEGSDDAAPAQVTIGEKGSEQDPLAGRDPILSVQPQRDPAVHQVEGILGVPAMSVKIDPRTLGVAPGEPLPNLRREGEAVRKRDGRLLPAGDRGYAVFILDADPEAGDKQPLAMVVAPCMMLESMERLQENRGDDLRFTLTGEVHTYRGVNYLLPTSQPKPWLAVPEAVEQTPGDQTTQTSEAAASDEHDASEKNETPVTPGDVQKENENADAGEKPAGNDADATPSSDQVLEELLKQRRGPASTTKPTGTEHDWDDPPQLVASSNDPGLLTNPLLMSMDPDQPQVELKKEGEFLIARTGRLIRTSDGAHSLFVLDSDQAGAPEAPMIMQACKLLETMEKTVREQGDDAPFVVTGQVYVYRGANYLLPTIVKREFDRGNLE